ncbi:MAG: HAD-IA family hydrolase [Pseudomonadota bacterium]
MPTAPTAVFDLDGTLIDTAPDLLDAVNYVLKQAGLGQVERPELNHLVGQGGRAMIRAAFAKFGREIDEATLDEMIPIFIKAYSQSMPGKSKPYDRVLELIRSMRADGWLCAVCTNKMKQLADPLLAALELDTLFDHVAGGDSYSFKKPDPRHIQQTILDAGGSPDHAVMFGDSENDILAAKSANIPVIAVDFGYTPEHVSVYGPDRVISDYGQITIADVKELMTPISR